MNTLFHTIYKNKTVLITGHTGFKGSWLSVWLSSIGANVVGLSLNIPTTPSNFEASEVNKVLVDHRVDVRDSIKLREVIQESQPDFVFHLAAQALVRPSYESPLETIATNALGSANLLDALRILSKPVVAVMITSDKAYDNIEWVWGYRETDRLGGKDPYSASKGMAELAIHTFVESFFKVPESTVRVGITRAGNVIGGGDWAVDRVVPDCMTAWSQNEVVDIRSPDSTRPWQHVLEPLSGYLTLGAELTKKTEIHGEAYNFGPPAHQNHSVRELINEMTKYWDNIRWNDISKNREHLHEAGLLKLNCDKALFDLNWQPTLHFSETVRMTVEWYKNYYQNIDSSMFNFTAEQINEYTLFAKARHMKWATNDL
ncbi:MAG: CDP-glucose 4,6-dehydratase [Nitrospina sp.]|jgi:CDP-glucose 4,6-dehydratase|nr:CDP-glucose 4,6-dehydratase [Nitrospina sp.]